VNLQRLEFDFSGVNLERLDRARPKGRTIPESEKYVLKLGAKGEKKMTRKCTICGIKDGHNSRTCLSKEENRERLASLSGRKRGRPPGSRNRFQHTAPEWKESTSRKRHEIISDEESVGEESDTQSGEDGSSGERKGSPRTLRSRVK